MAELIITEKPNAAFKIATALADGKPQKHNIHGVPYYTITHKSKDIVVGCAVGHLYGLEEKKKNGWAFPVFDIHWVPTADMNKEAKFSKKYLNALKKLSKDASEFTVATDYDIEGEVIGLNVIRFACNRKDAARMKFSTLTKPDLVKSYESKSPHLDWGQAKAGETRHIMDWYYGINLSRALTSSIKSTGAFKILSIGRVQGPALKIIVDREKEIMAFKPVPFWLIQLLGIAKGSDIEAWHENGKFWGKNDADRVMQNVKGAKEGIVCGVKRSRFNQSPPFPFDLTALQIEAYRVHRIAPKDTLALAQDLYTGGFISYPRTSSQILPKEIGYSKILSALSRQSTYAQLANSLLTTPLAPNNGKKTDPAHPAVYPTGIPPKASGRHMKVYDLIVRRFMATFGKPAVRETMEIIINVNNEKFVAKGTRTVDKGWHIYYGPYVRLEEVELPAVVEGDVVKVKKINLLDKETEPPKRYTPASIIKELEKRNLGTKATRAQIIDTLYQRGYIDGTAIKATGLGIHTVATLEKYSPRILDEELTRHFEGDMDKIREGTKKADEVLEESKNVVVDIIGAFKGKEKKIGEGLKEAHYESEKKAKTVGKCPVCNDGELIIRKGKYGRFIACSKYPDCKTTFSLPSSGAVKVSEKVCESCKHPMITMIRKAKKPQDVCINKECPSKQVDEKNYGEKPCPKCKEGRLVLRKSIYGSFLGCSTYPKCKYTEKI